MPHSILCLPIRFPILSHQVPWFRGSVVPWFCGSVVLRDPAGLRHRFPSFPLCLQYAYQRRLQNHATSTRPQGHKDSLPLHRERSGSLNLGVNAELTLLSASVCRPMTGTTIVGLHDRRWENGNGRPFVFTLSRARGGTHVSYPSNLRSLK